eukprot:scaffold10910_cov75-Phaeocystis_antarctica.AAC.3
MAYVLQVVTLRGGEQIVNGRDPAHRGDARLFRRRRERGRVLTSAAANATPRSRLRQRRQRGCD